MRKILLVLFTAFLLAGCSDDTDAGGHKIHKSIDENLAIDTIQVVEVVDNAVENGEELDHKVLERYVEVYEEKFNDFNDVDKGLYVQGKLIAQQAESFSTLESSKKNFNLFKEHILYYIEHGENQEDTSQ